MKKYPLLAAAALVLFAAGFARTAVTQPAPAPDAADPQGEYFAPGLDDLMTMLIQPRHTKLYYAGQARNWELAAAQTRELRQAFNRAAATIPSNRGYDIPVLMDRFVFTQLDDMSAAVKAADSKRFARVYKDLTAGCNACHTYMEHPYDVIRVPDAKAYPDQDFRPAK